MKISGKYANHFERADCSSRLLFITSNSIELSTLEPLTKPYRLYRMINSLLAYIRSITESRLENSNANKNWMTFSVTIIPFVQLIPILNTLQNPCMSWHWLMKVRDKKPNLCNGVCCEVMSSDNNIVSREREKELPESEYTLRTWH